MTAPRCPHCLDEGHVCEDHPSFPWEGLHGTIEGHAGHGGIGMPCPACCPPVPEDGTHPITEAFTPGWMRAGKGPTIHSASGLELLKARAEGGDSSGPLPPGTYLIES